MVIEVRSITPNSVTLPATATDSIATTTASVQSAPCSYHTNATHHNQSPPPIAQPVPHSSINMLPPPPLSRPPTLPDRTRPRPRPHPPPPRPHYKVWCTKPTLRDKNCWGPWLNSWAPTVRIWADTVVSWRLLSGSLPVSHAAFLQKYLFYFAHLLLVSARQLRHLSL